MANKEPLVVVKASIDVVGEVIGEDCGDGRDGVVREREAALSRGGRGGIYKGTPGAKNRDIGCGRGTSGHRWPKVFASGGGDKYVVGVDGNVFVERGEEEGVEDFLSYAGRSGRHGRREWNN